MVKHKVAELEGALLDAAVAKATGDVWQHSHLYRADMQNAPYSTEWECGGPIIERERIELLQMHTPREPALWMASPVISMQEGEISSDWHGPTPLIAAMRAYVASKFGEEVEL
jgi:hypothetical protein